MLKYKLRADELTSFPRPENMPEALYRLLAGRGVASAEAAAAFLNPGPDSLRDPFELNDMAAAAGRIKAAVDGKEVICVYGDYDVDGVCASAILSGYLTALGADARVYLPSRHSEGYGLNEAAIRKIALWAKLLVTVDCGVTSVALVALAKQLGMDVIVTDHHRPAEALPDCPVVNPLLGGYAFASLCGAGVAWKLVWALGGRDAAMPWVDVAALATVADVVPLTGENRAIVRMGLDAINRAPRTGVAALIGAAGLTGKRITSTSIAFQLAPRLNAGGRLGSAQRSLDLVLAREPALAHRLAMELEEENTRRRTVEAQILRQAQAQLEDFDFLAHRALILAGRDWNPGVIGLAASRLVEQYHYPVILLSDQGDKMTGSCRSIEGVDIHAALTGCADTLVKFGGHRQAAGLTLLPDRLEDFVRAMDAWLTENVAPEAYIPVQEYDAPLDFESVTSGFVAALEDLQPTGFGNPAPLFRASAEVVEARAVGAEGAHLKLTLAQGGHRLGGIAFREGSRAGQLSGSVDALFAVEMNAWMGRSEPQLQVKALADADVDGRLRSKLADESALQCEFLTEIFYNKKIPPEIRDAPEIDDETLADWLRKRPQGTLVLTFDIAATQRLMQLCASCPPDLCLGELPADPRAFNAVCVCPAKGRVPRSYDRLVLAGIPAEAAPEAGGAQVFRLAGCGGPGGVMPDIDGLRLAYRAAMRVVRRPVWCLSLAQLAYMTAEEAATDDAAAQGPVSTPAAAAAILAMADMGLFELDMNSRPVALRRLARAKASPEQSAVWRVMQRWREKERAQQDA
ncbi:MAG: single-stranded-DNA-specific exonuclease RecJ [Clostridia bacterium]|nr:single-stranded-DNA-specific exonuclease RecJ [Clostridia bacterium]